MHTVTVPVTQGAIDYSGTIDGSWDGGGASGSATFGGPNTAFVASSMLITVHLSYDVTGHVPAGDNIAVGGGTVSGTVSPTATPVTGYEGGLPSFSVDSHGVSAPDGSSVPFTFSVNSPFQYRTNCGYSLPE